MNPAHRALRAATREAHERVDALFSRFDLADREGYGDFLSAIAGAHLALEAALDTAGAERLVPAWPRLKRGERLREDLAKLGRPLPSPEPLPGAWSDSGIIGTLYVLEGSKIGARMLVQRIPEQFSDHFVSVSEPVETLRKIMDDVAPLLAGEAAERSAIAAARDAFALFERCARTWLME